MWAVFEKAFYDARRTILWVSVGLAIFALFTAALFPAIAEEGEEFTQVFESMPDSVIGLIGGDINLTDPIVWINSQFTIWAVLVLGAVVMVQAFNAITNAERDGTMDVMMSFPISRHEMLIGRYLNTLVTLVIILTATLAALFAGTQIWPELDIAPGDLATMIYGSLVILVPYATFTYALTTFIPSSKRWAGAIAYTIFFGMYFVHAMAGASDALSNIRPLMLFDYYNGADMARQGLDFGHFALMAAISMVCGVVAWWQIDNKELGV